MFDTVPGGLKPNLQAVANSPDGWDKDILTDDRTIIVLVEPVIRLLSIFISPQGNGVYAQGVDTHEDQNRICDVCESAANVIRRFLVQVGFSED